MLFLKNFYVYSSFVHLFSIYSMLLDSTTSFAFTTTYAKAVLSTENLSFPPYNIISKASFDGLKTSTISIWYFYFI